ncbi:MAG: 4Fe-4S dicluster domain-containing protein [Odoribacteraceae bacterium]|jgi:NADH-quinone oxidoreductase subunit I|nr:4Fe-4S dicluster domain-containing protein [Odoribacteraceae bacterium]
MNNASEYIVNFARGTRSLLVGMRATLRVFFRAKTTERYPENRATLTMFDRFRGELVMLHDEQNYHRCTACGICEMNCPNGTLRVTSEWVVDEAGKKKKSLVEYQYDLGSCLFCQLCVRTCAQQALGFLPTFEHAVFTRGKLIHKLNREGSSLAPKPVAESHTV